MRIRVRLGEPYWRQAGARELDLELAPGATIADALGAVAARFPALLDGDLPPTTLRGDELADPQTPLADGETVTLVWAVAGG